MMKSTKLISRLLNPFVLTWSCIALLMSIISTAALADSSNSVPTAMADSMITAKIKSQLAIDSVTSATTIGVETNNAIVSLSGTVGSATEASRAVAIAESTSGVKDVNTDNLTVKGSSQPLTDSYTTAKIEGLLVREKIFGNSSIPVTAIKVETQNGNVYLTGTVNSQRQKEKVINLAQSVNGVRQVNADLTIDRNANS